MLFSFFFLFWRIGESSRREDFLRARQRPRRNRIRSLSNLSIFIITITRYRGRSRFCFPSSSPSSRQNPIALRIFSNRIDRWREKIYINTFLAAHPEIDKKKNKKKSSSFFFPYFFTTLWKLIWIFDGSIVLCAGARADTRRWDGSSSSSVEWEGVVISLFSFFFLSYSNGGPLFYFIWTGIKESISQHPGTALLGSRAVTRPK